MAVEAAPPAPARGARALDWLRANWLLLAMCVLAALPVIVSTAHELVAGWAPAGDDAVIATRSYDVFSSRSPLVGQYSAASTALGQATYSPGPLLYWLLAIPARIAPILMLLTMALLNAACAVGVVLLARRRGGALLMIAAATGMALMARSLDQHVWADVWNPAAALMPFALLIFVTLSLACGELWLLPLAVAVASFVVQCHLGYAIPVAGLLLVGLVGLFLARRRGDLSGGRRSLLVALGVAVACWIAPLIEQLRHWPGNLSAIAHAATGRGETLGLARGLHELVGAIGVPPYWGRASRTVNERLYDVAFDHGFARDASAVVLIVLLIAVAVLALRRRDRVVAFACAQALVLCAAIVAVTASVPTAKGLGFTVAYTLWWSAPAGMYAWLVAGWGVTRAVAPLGRLLEGRGLRAVAALGVVVAVLATIDATPGPDELEARYRPVRDLRGPLAAAVRGHGSVRVDIAGRWTFPKFDFQTAIAYELRRHGVDVRAPSLRVNLGSRYARGGEPGRVVRVGDPSLRPGPAGRVIARVAISPDSGVFVGKPETVVVTVGP
ncbi:MAG: hypothetical protein QOG63_1616 [Thermoleophilaceae bacterium]|nr:hypothetical protein [Thermoleophilaceae bacterium]